MKVSDIFHSIQGEGVTAGYPAIFIRLGGCNLSCWFCDTKYTWLFSKEQANHVKEDIKRLQAPIPRDLKVYNPDFELKEMKPEEIIKRINKFKCDRLVVTGGEPMLQQRELLDLFVKMKDNTSVKYIEVETNGTILPDILIRKHVSQWNVSPKISSSGNKKELWLNPDVLIFFSQIPHKAWFKFVITSQKDMKEVFKLIRDYNLMPDRIILMPEATTSQELKAKSQWLINICKKHNFIFGNRIHVQVWGQQRGI